jgi:hypothetical protein
MHGVTISDINDCRMHGSPPRTEGLSDALQRLSGNIAEHQSEPAVRELVSEGLTNTTGSSGDNGNLTGGEAHAGRN